MAHIRQIQKTENDPYTVVLDSENLGHEHPCLTEHPDLFEYVKSDAPQQCQFLNYS